MISNATQLKSLIKKISLEKQIHPQLVLQNYILERFLYRISLSPYVDNFIIKGGFLISAILGIANRTTRDLDVSIKGYPVKIEEIGEMIKEIIAIETDDKFSFEFKNIKEIHKNDKYGGFRVSLLANYQNLVTPLKIDITTGDKITPKEIKYEYKTMFDNNSLFVLAYNLESIVAEKIESVFSRELQNTRLRDFYDIYSIIKLQENNLNFNTLKQAILNTGEKRKSQEKIINYADTIAKIKVSQILLNLWSNYQKEFSYAKEINFGEICDLIKQTMDKLLQTN